MTFLHGFLIAMALAAIPAAFLVTAFVLVIRSERRERDLNDHVDQALALLADPEQADLDMWDREMAEGDRLARERGRRG